jgi:hypothetical protein
MKNFIYFIFFACLFNLLAAGIYAGTTYCCFNFKPYSDLSPIGLIMLLLWHLAATCAGYLAAEDMD